MELKLAKCVAERAQAEERAVAETERRVRTLSERASERSVPTDESSPSPTNELASPTNRLTSLINEPFLSHTWQVGAETERRLRTELAAQSEQLHAEARLESARLARVAEEKVSRRRP